MCIRTRTIKRLVILGVRSPNNVGFFHAASRHNSMFSLVFFFQADPDLSSLDIYRMPCLCFSPWDMELPGERENGMLHHYEISLTG